MVSISMSDNYNQGQMIGLAVFLIFLAIVAASLRAWAKIVGRGRLTWDDYLCFAAAVFALAGNISQLVAAIAGRLGQHQVVDKQGMPVLDDPEFITYETCKFVVNLFNVTGLGLIKSSILVFYMGIFRGRAFVIASRIVLGIVIAWAISYFFTNLLVCWPVSVLTEGSAYYENKCYPALPMWNSMAITDIIVDLVILTLPIPLVLRLHLPPKQKLGVLGMLFLGALVCAFSITRLFVYIHIDEQLVVHYNDITYYTSPSLFWGNIELSTAILSASLPTYRSIWLHLRGKGINSTVHTSEERSRYGYGKSVSGHFTYGSQSIPLPSEDEIQLQPVLTRQQYLAGSHKSVRSSSMV